jgi:hypothetical protein
MRETQMRLLIVPVFALVATPALALDMPPRKPGLWEIRTILENRNTPPAEAATSGHPLTSCKI